MDISNKTENILVAGDFLDTLREALRSVGNGVTRAGLSLPNGIVKVSLHTFDELPKSRSKIEELIIWKEKGMLPFPVDKAKTAYCLLEQSPGEKKKLLVAVGSQDIIRDYEMNLRKLRIYPEVVQASAVNHLNFYIDHLPSSGIHAFLGVFEDYFTFFVIEEGQPSFYRGKRRHPMHIRFLHEISMTMQLYKNENPGKTVETLFIQSQVALPQEFDKDLIEDSAVETITIDENGIISPEPHLFGDSQDVRIASYASAIGAALSLVAR